MKRKRLEVKIQSHVWKRSEYLFRRAGILEHQLGTAVDFTSVSLGAVFEKFDSTTPYFWLTENAYTYGFVLSYPKDNAYYIYEPWHWRYVGVELATKLKNEKKNFYDMDSASSPSIS